MRTQLHLIAAAGLVAAACSSDPAAPAAVTSAADTVSTTGDAAGPGGSDGVPIAGEDSGTPGPGADGTTAGEDATGPFTACSENGDCPSGFCLDQGEGAGICTIPCVDECPAGWLCKGVSNFGSDLTLVCVKDASTPCKACTTKDECGGSHDECVAVGVTGTFCASTCTTALECPDGMGCKDGHCLPATGSCVCTAELIGKKRPCSVGNDLGTCFGLETCTGPNGWEGCTAKTPVAETCDGQDDDCNGIADDDVALGSCAIDNAAGSCPGYEKCEGFAGVTCVAKTPAADVCNGADDNCDGTTDEGSPDPDADGLASCVDPDDDGDGVPDSLDCAPDDPTSSTSSPELCNGVDDNCNGKTDEGFPETDGDGTANCVDGDDDDDGVADGADCAPLDADVFSGAAEQCNGQDDNCNGLTDEGSPDLDQDGVADCIDPDTDGDGDPNASDCAPDNANVHHDAAELCDGVDENCNGAKDDGYLDSDGDGEANCIDLDDDGDGALDTGDNCPLAKNPDQADGDKDGLGDACDPVQPGPLHHVLVRSEAGGLGQEVGDVGLTLLDTLDLVAAGYDDKGLFVGDQKVKWTVTGTLDAIFPGPGAENTFLPKKAGTSGTIVAIPLDPNVAGDATGTVTVAYPPVGAPSLDLSLIYPDKSELVAGGTSTATVFVELVDGFGQPVTAPQGVEIATTLGTMQGAVAYLGGGLYQQTLVSSKKAGTATLSALVNGQLLTQTAEVQMIEEVDLIASGITTVDCANYPGLKGKNLVVSGGTVIMNTTGCGPLQLGKLEVLNGGVLTHDGCDKPANRIELLVTGLLVDATSKIDVSGKGYAVGAAPPSSTAAPDGTGGSHGGHATGAKASNATYDSLSAPKWAGAAGGSGGQGAGGCGGGVVVITVTNGGVATIQGSIRANGNPGYQTTSGQTPTFGSGAGGSIHVSAPKLIGGGLIEANGGSVTQSNCNGWVYCYAPARHGGGGGRIALTDTVVTAGSFVPPALFTKVTAYGGWGPEAPSGGYSGAGTVWLQGANDAGGTLVVSNGGHVSASGTPLPMVPEGTVLEVTKVKLTEYGKFVPDLFSATWVNPNVAQGLATTMTDDTLVRVLSNDADSLFFSPADAVSTLTDVGKTFRGALKLSRLEVRDGAELVASGDLLILDGDLHTPPEPGEPTTFEVMKGSKLTAHRLEVPGAILTTIKGDVTATQKLCSNCN